MLRRIISLSIIIGLIFQQVSFAQMAAELNIAGYLARMHSGLSIDKFRPLHLRYFNYDINSHNFKVLIDKGDLKNTGTEELENSTKELLNYFLVGVTLNNESFWVNLRPDSEDQIIDPYLVQTDVGKIMLEADLQLKKDTAKLTSPETPEGREYWNRLYKKAEELFGYDSVNIPTLTRPWIVPGEIIIHETDSSAYIYKATLKVMLEQDYLKDSAMYNFNDARSKALNDYSSELIRELIIPKLTKEVNSSKRYANIRQVYYSLILSRWFKNKFGGQSGGYASRINTLDLTGLTSQNNWSKTTYFKEYQKSFKEGEYNIKEPVYTPTGQVIRNYFSGGMNLGTINTNNGIAGSPAVPKARNTVMLEGDSLNIREATGAGSPVIVFLPNLRERIDTIIEKLKELEKGGNAELIGKVTTSIKEISPSVFTEGKYSVEDIVNFINSLWDTLINLQREYLRLEDVSEYNFDLRDEQKLDKSVTAKQNTLEERKSKTKELIGLLESIEGIIGIETVISKGPFDSKVGVADQNPEGAAGSPMIVKLKEDNLSADYRVFKDILEWRINTQILPKILQETKVSPLRQDEIREISGSYGPNDYFYNARFTMSAQGEVNIVSLRISVRNKTILGYPSFAVGSPLTQEEAISASETTVLGSFYNYPTEKTSVVINLREKPEFIEKGMAVYRLKDLRETATEERKEDKLLFTINFKDDGSPVLNGNNVFPDKETKNVWRVNRSQFYGYEVTKKDPNLGYELKIEYDLENRTLVIAASERTLKALPDASNYQVRLGPVSSAKAQNEVAAGSPMTQEEAVLALEARNQKGESNFPQDLLKDDSDLFETARTMRIPIVSKHDKAIYVWDPDSLEKAIQQEYDRGNNDEKMTPIITVDENGVPVAALANKEGRVPVLRGPFRKDRQKQESRAQFNAGSLPFAIPPELVGILSKIPIFTKTRYIPQIPQERVILQDAIVKNSLVEVLSKEGINIVWVFDGEKSEFIPTFRGREEPFANEDLEYGLVSMPVLLTGERVKELNPPVSLKLNEDKDEYIVWFYGGVPDSVTEKEKLQNNDYWRYVALSAFRLADANIKKIKAARPGTFGATNISLPDLNGHVSIKNLDKTAELFIEKEDGTFEMKKGNGWDSALECLKVSDKVVGNIYKAVEDKEGVLVLVGDHGSLDDMTQNGHSFNDVPIFIIDFKNKDIKLVKAKGNAKDTQADVAATILHIYGKPKLAEMTGKSLLPDTYVGKEDRIVWQVILDGFGHADFDDPQNAFGVAMKRGFMPTIKRLYEQNNYVILRAAGQYAGLRGGRQEDFAPKELKTREQMLKEVQAAEVLKILKIKIVQYDYRQIPEATQTYDYDRGLRELRESPFLNDKDFVVKILAAGNGATIQVLCLDPVQMGSTEYNLLSLGGGRIVEQSIVELDKKFITGEIFDTRAWREFITLAKDAKTALMIDMLQEFAVHDSLRHLFYELREMRKSGVERFMFILALDGRDEGKYDAIKKRIPQFRQALKLFGITNYSIDVVGRQLSFDRDKNWNGITMPWVYQELWGTRQQLQQVASPIKDKGVASSAVQIGFDAKFTADWRTTKQDVLKDLIKLGQLLNGKQPGNITFTRDWLLNWVDDKMIAEANQMAINNGEAGINVGTAAILNFLRYFIPETRDKKYQPSDFIYFTLGVLRLNFKEEEIKGQAILPTEEFLFAKLKELLREKGEVSLYFSGLTPVATEVRKAQSEQQKISVGSPISAVSPFTAKELSILAESLKAVSSKSSYGRSITYKLASGHLLSANYVPMQGGSDITLSKGDKILKRTIRGNYSKAPAVAIMKELAAIVADEETAANSAVQAQGEGVSAGSPIEVAKVMKDVEEEFTRAGVYLYELGKSAIERYCEDNITLSVAIQDLVKSQGKYYVDNDFAMRILISATQAVKHELFPLAREAIESYLNKEIDIDQAIKQITTSNPEITRDKAREILQEAYEKVLVHKGKMQLLDKISSPEFSYLTILTPRLNGKLVEVQTLAQLGNFLEELFKIAQEQIKIIEQNVMSLPDDSAKESIDNTRNNIAGLQQLKDFIVDALMQLFSQEIANVLTENRTLDIYLRPEDGDYYFRAFSNRSNAYHIVNALHAKQYERYPKLHQLFSNLLEVGFRPVSEVTFNDRQTVDDIQATLLANAGSSPLEVSDTPTSTLQSAPKTTGGIDFRALPMTIKPMGSFEGLNLRLPQLTPEALTNFNLSQEIGQLNQMIAGGIIPSGMRVQELIAAAWQRGQLQDYQSEILTLLAEICKLQEGECCEASDELKVALIAANAV
jgi:bisphosphoglycerate-independent phosphoglycerate mutase (AlkP superfamily)